LFSGFCVKPRRKYATCVFLDAEIDEPASTGFTFGSLAIVLSDHANHISGEHCEVVRAQGDCAHTSLHVDEVELGELVGSAPHD
jgi:hypothetical protein